MRDASAPGYDRANDPELTRQAFPYADDRRVIADFLAGRRDRANPPCLTKTTLICNPGTGTLNFLERNRSLAWFSRDDQALYAKLLPEPAYSPGVRVLHVIMDMLGRPHARVVREISEVMAPTCGAHCDPQRVAIYFFDNSPTAIDQPFVICGAVDVLAYRANLKSPPPTLAR